MRTGCDGGAISLVHDTRDGWQTHTRAESQDEPIPFSCVEHPFLRLLFTAHSAEI